MTWAGGRERGGGGARDIEEIRCGQRERAREGGKPYAYAETRKVPFWLHVKFSAVSSRLSFPSACSERSAGAADRAPPSCRHR